MNSTQLASLCLQHLISLLQIEDVAGDAARRVAGVASAQDIVKYVAHVDTHTHCRDSSCTRRFPLFRQALGDASTQLKPLVAASMAAAAAHVAASCASNAAATR